MPDVTDVINNLMGLTQKRYNGGGPMPDHITPGGMMGYPPPDSMLLSTNETAHIGPILTQNPQELQTVPHYGGPVVNSFPGQAGTMVHMTHDKTGVVTQVQYPTPNTPLIGPQQKQDLKQGVYTGGIGAIAGKFISFLFGG